MCGPGVSGVGAYVKSGLSTVVYSSDEEGSESEGSESEGSDASSDSSGDESEGERK